VFHQLPALSEIRGVVIHRRYMVNSNLVQVEISENICLECTILTEHGVEHERYTKQLFNVECMSAHIVRNKTNLIMVQLDEVRAPDPVDFSQNPRPSTQEVVDLSQTTQQTFHQHLGLSQTSFSQQSQPPFSQQSQCTTYPFSQPTIPEEASHDLLEDDMAIPTEAIGKMGPTM
jgi:hypothetical protein